MESGKNNLITIWVFTSILSLIVTSSVAQNSDWVLGESWHVFNLSNELDTNGNLITLGTIYGADGPVDVDPGSGEFMIESDAMDWPHFLRKIDSQGEVVWIKVLDSEFSEMKLDDAGNIYLATSFSLPFDADPTAGEQIFNAEPFIEDYSVSNIALTKLDASGFFLWSKQIGTGGSSRLGEIEMIHGGGVYLTGEFQDSVDFDPGSAENHLSCSCANERSDGFILKLDATGSFIWVRHMDAQGVESDINILTSSIDHSNNLIISGAANGSVELDTSVFGYEISFITDSKFFISKYDSAGNFIWVRENGESDDSKHLLIGSDFAGSVYMGGTFDGSVDLDMSGSELTTSFGERDFYIKKIDVDGNFVWLKHFGGPYDDYLAHATVDELGNIYHYGAFQGMVDLDPGSEVLNYIAYGDGYYMGMVYYAGFERYEKIPSIDTYVQKLDSSGTLVWTGQIGGKYQDYQSAHDILLDSLGNVYLLGDYRGVVDFRPGPDSLVLNISELNGMNVIVKLDQPIEGVTPAFIHQSISYYPNPVDEMLTIKSGQLYGTYQMRLINIQGEVVFNGECEAELDYLMVDHLLPGLYILQLTKEEENYFFKIIVQ
jgi:hypothetical protein